MHEHARSIAIKSGIRTAKASANAGTITVVLEYSSWPRFRDTWDKRKRETVGEF